MNDLEMQARESALSKALAKALAKDNTQPPSTADDIVADAQMFFKFLKKSGDQA